MHFIIGIILSSLVVVQLMGDQPWIFCAKSGNLCHLLYLPGHKQDFLVKYCYQDSCRLKRVFSGEKFIHCSISVFGDPSLSTPSYLNECYFKPTPKQYGLENPFYEISGEWKKGRPFPSNINNDNVFFHGVTKFNFLALTDTWVDLLIKSTSAQCKFKYDNTLLNLTTRASDLISQMSKASFNQWFTSHGFNLDPSTIRCTSPSNVIYTWQWVLSVNEVDDNGDEDSFNIYTYNLVHTTRDRMPVCPVGSCANSECTECLNDTFRQA